MQGFFVGVADTLVPALMPLLEAADGIDLSGLGQDLGNAIAFGLTVITSGNLGNIFPRNSSCRGSMLNTIYKGLIGITAFLVQRFIDIPADFLKVMKVITQPAFWAGLAQGLLAAALGFGRAIAMSVADLLASLREIPALAGALEAPLDAAIGVADSAGVAQLKLQNAAAANLEEPVNQLREQALQSFTNAIAAADEAMQGASQIDTTEIASRPRRFGRGDHHANGSQPRSRPLSLRCHQDPDPANGRHGRPGGQKQHRRHRAKPCRRSEGARPSPDSPMRPTLPPRPCASKRNPTTTFKRLLKGSTTSATGTVH
jgi:hypothetical protein